MLYVSVSALLRKLGPTDLHCDAVLGYRPPESAQDAEHPPAVCGACQLAPATVMVGSPPSIPTVATAAVYS